MKKKTRSSVSDTSPSPRRGPTPPGDEIGAAELASRLADRLRELRRAREWSLDDLSRASGVSRAALWQIETLKSNPSIGVLWKIATGFGLPFSDLFGSEGGRVLVSRRADVPAVRSKDGVMESRLVSPPGGAVGVEVYELRLAARAKHEAEGHSPGTREILSVLSGVVRVHLGAEVFEAGPGDSIAFPADKPHAYVNPGQSEARCHDIIIYPH